MEEKRNNDKKDGPALAASLSAAIGCCVLGLMTVLAMANSAVKELLNWYAPSGPLSGKSGIAVIIWLVTWIVLHFSWKNREIKFGKIWKLSLILIVIGFLFTFPPFFELFERH